VTLQIRVHCRTVADLVDVREDGEDVLLESKPESVVRQVFEAIAHRPYTAADVVASTKGQRQRRPADAGTKAPANVDGGPALSGCSNGPTGASPGTRPGPLAFRGGGEKRR
jgi:hypothetical protein